MKIKLDWWIRILILIGAFLVFLNYGILGGFVSWAGMTFATKKCIELADRVKSNRTIAALVGIMFSVIGLFFYWIYYQFREDSMEAI